MDINWLHVGDMPREMRDGREILLAQPNALGTADGGDGKMLNPRSPYLFYVATWNGDRWRTSEGDGCGDSIYLEPHEPSHYAEINSPT